MSSLLDMYPDLKMSQPTQDAYALLESRVRPMTEKMQAFCDAAPENEKWLYFGMLMEGAMVSDSSDEELSGSTPC